MTKHYTRRNFLQISALAAGALAFPSAIKIYKPLIAFSTLGCPGWSLDVILRFATEHGYDGIELRGLQEQVDLTQCAEFSKENIQITRKKIKAARLKITDLGASTMLHYADETERRKNLAEAKRYIDLAEQLNCPYVRVFPNNFPKEQSKDETIQRIVKGLLELADYAQSRNVTVLMETHGDVVESADLEKIMQEAAHPHVGLIWDIVNMWSVTKEPVSQVYSRLKKYIQHAHIKDVKFINEQKQYVLLGRGDTPVFDAIDLLAKDNFKGYYSFEWEKRWHPELEEPEIALADYIKVIKQHFKI